MEKELRIQLEKEKNLSSEYASRLLRAIQYVEEHKQVYGDLDEFDVLASPRVLISILSGVYKNNEISDENIKAKSK